MRTFEKECDTVVCFDFNVWKQERNVIYFSHDNSVAQGNTAYLYSNLQSSPLAVYSLTADGKLSIDVSDYIRAYPSVTRFSVECVQGSVINIPLQVVGLINPARVLIPSNVSGDFIEPPTQMLAACNAAGIAPEFCARESGGELRVYPDFQLIDIEEAGIPITFPAVSPSFYTLYTPYDELFRYNVRPLDECKRYAAVRWVSFTGATRVHTFEVRDASQSAGEVVNLETIDGSYNQIKGRTDGFKLYLEDLNAYDYWYYADVITSSKVEVSFDGLTFYQVEVTTRSVTIPNTSEGQNNKLEINVNWRNYDAVAM